nr:hypothetical protein [Tanacetum cinerariifolium]
PGFAAPVRFRAGMLGVIGAAQRGFRGCEQSYPRLHGKPVGAPAWFASGPAPSLFSESAFPLRPCRLAAGGRCRGAPQR